MSRAYEFWHPRIFEAPYYLYLLLQCALRKLPIKYLAKANFALDHGELGLGSKYATQMAFHQEKFLPTQLLTPTCAADLVTAVETFADKHGYPLILKPDIGVVGKGIVKISQQAEVAAAITVVRSAFLLQAFTPFEFEYGVFFIRQQGINKITGINQKHFPTVVGNGVDSILTLAKNHYRFTHHWHIFLKYLDTERIPTKDEIVQLSFIGSHTMGCMFTHDTHLLTPKLEQAISTVCDSQPGFNFGRLDVKAHSEEKFRQGDFVVIEVNGIASLPTHMFDPQNSLGEAYKIFLQHGKYLTKIADEHRLQPMQLKSYADIWQLAKTNATLLNKLHDHAKSL